MPTTFELTEQSELKHKRNYDSSEKKPNVTMKTAREAEMLICKNCGQNWNEHTAWATKKYPAGMCLTEANFKETGTYLIS